MRSLLKIFLPILFALTLLLNACSTPKNPNIVIIYTDDQGYGSVLYWIPDPKKKWAIFNLKLKKGNRIC